MGEVRSPSADLVNSYQGAFLPLLPSRGVFSIDYSDKEVCVQSFCCAFFASIFIHVLTHLPVVSEGLPGQTLQRLFLLTSWQSEIYYVYCGYIHSRYIKGNRDQFHKLIC